MPILILLCLALASPIVRANILRVPETYPDIVSAVAASGEGDTILVGQGIYCQRILLPPGQRTLASHYLLTEDTQDIQNTVLEPDSQGSADSLAIIQIENSATTAALVGLTLQHGRGVVVQGETSGGAIFQLGGALHLDHCALLENNVQWIGGALYADSGATVVISHSEFQDDSAFEGGAVNVQNGSLHVSGTRLHGNIAHWGPAIWSQLSRVQMDSCLVDSNGSDYNFYDAVIFAGSPGSVTNSDFIGNRANPDYGQGAALSFAASDLIYPDSASIQHCRFIENVGHSCPGTVIDAHYGIVEDCLYEGNHASLSIVFECGPYTTRVSRCVFRGNTAAWWSVLGAVPHAIVNLQECVFDSNASTGADSGAVVSGYLNTWTASRCSFTGNIPAAINNAYDSRGVLHVENCWWGDPSGPFHSTMNPNGRGQIIYGDSVYFIPWLTEPPADVPQPRRPALPMSPLLVSVFPNPFNSVTTVSFTLSHASNANLTVYDVSGRVVQTLIRGRLEAGEHHVMFAPQALASGIYFVQVSAGGLLRVQKMVLLK